MLSFKKLCYEDYELLREYFIRDNRNHRSRGWDITCDHVFGTTFLWREYYNTSYAVIDDAVILKISTGGTDMFSVPIGCGNIKPILEKLKSYAHGRGLPLYFTFVPDAYIPSFLDAFDIVFSSEEPDWFDYVYDIEPLRSYSGRAYHGQKNFLNRYVKQNSNAEYIPISAANTEAVISFAKDWEERFSDKSEMATAEYNSIVDLLHRWEDNPCLFGGYVTSNTGISGFTIAEAVDDTVYIHIEKADHTVSGAYQFLSSEFLKRIDDVNIKFVNREEDMGIEGLRKSKMGLHPVKLLKKYTLYCC